MHATDIVGYGCHGDVVCVNCHAQIDKGTDPLNQHEDYCSPIFGDAEPGDTGVDYCVSCDEIVVGTESEQSYTFGSVKGIQALWRKQSQSHLPFSMALNYGDFQAVVIALASHSGLISSDDMRKLFGKSEHIKEANDRIESLLGAIAESLDVDWE